MKLKNLTAALLLILSGTAPVMADAVLTINGIKVEKTVVRINFEGDNVKLTFGDDSTSTYDMGEVSFSFVPSAGIESIPSFNSLSVMVGDMLEISGISDACLLEVYDLRGIRVAKAAAIGNKCVIDISNLESGAYLLKIENEIVKFIKR